MKKQGLATILGVVIVLSLGTGFAFQNEPEGFRGLKWGNQPIQKMIPYSHDIYGMTTYTLPDEKLRLGDARLSTVIYAFYGTPGQFMGVNLVFDGEENYYILETICREKFGEETEKESTEKFYQVTWTSPSSMVILRYDLADGGICPKGSGALGLLGKIFLEYEDAKAKKQAERAEEDW